MEERAEWTLTLREIFQDVQVQAVEASGYLRNPSGIAHQRTLVPSVRRLNTLFNDEVKDGKRGVVEEAFVLFLDEIWLAMARVLVASKVSDVVLLAVASFVGEFLRRKSSKSKELKGKEELRVELLKRLMDATKAEDRAVRLRACHMLQVVANRLDYIEEELETQLKATMLKRLNDKLTSVRIQSIYGLKNLQNPEQDEDDEVTQELRKLMVSDPSKDVRKAALLSLTVSKKLYQDLLVRIRDASEDVRYAAFRTIGNSMPLEEIPVSDRAHLLDQGLQDRAARVRRACEQMVLKKWFPECGSSPVLLLKALDIEQYSDMGSKASRLLLKHFSEQPRALLEKEGVVEFNALDIMSENSDAFNAESVFFWREQCYYYQKIDNDPDKAAALVPNVSDFSKMLVATCKAESDVLFIAQQLLEFGHLLDFQDEFGRRNLLDALQKLLRELDTDSQLIKGVMELMAFVYSGSSEQEFIQVVAEVISDMYDPVEVGNQNNSTSQQEDSEAPASQQEASAEDETAALSFGPQLHKLSEEDREAAEAKFEELEKHLETLEFDSEEYNKVQTEMVALEALLQDPRVLSWLRCLEIVAQLLKLTSHNLSDPIVDGMSRYILPAIDSDVPALREAGLENLGLFCLLDKRLAERYLIVFWRALNNPEEESEVKHTCVQSILDMAFSFTNLQPHIFGAKQARGSGDKEEEKDERAKESESRENSQDDENNDDQGGDKDENKDQDEDMDKNGDPELAVGVEKLDLDAIFVGLGQLISVDDVDLQSTIVEGFCRLFMMNRIDNITVLAILLETYFSPKLQKVQQQSEHGFQSRSLQLLSIFFPAFVMATSANCMLLEEAATHLIQKSMEKLEMESDDMLDLSACAKYVLHLLSHSDQEQEAAAVQTRKGRAKKPQRRRCAHHNRIGITICLEMLALDKVSAMPSIHQDVVITRQKTLLKMIAWVEVTLDEQRSAALFKYLLQEITSLCFGSQKGLLRSAEAALKRTLASYSEQSTEPSEDQTAALEQDQVWAHDLVKEREEVLLTVLVRASADHEKWLKRQKKAQRRRNARYVSSGSSDSSDSESDQDGDDEEPATAPARRELSSRRSKTAAVSRMHEKEGEFDARIKQALQADDADEEDEEEYDEDSETEGDEESDAEDEDGEEDVEDEEE
ncbi:Nuclear condensing complex subunit [Phytophthora infestans]|uniref:Nuclear condensing complex subunit n=1 Tax=Phytophthora infestans TaxID=4787 RepID=A0A833WL14_PHYIN|nr:Nuclear condensing complex subunit [Phytophthora infestans]